MSELPGPASDHTIIHCGRDRIHHVRTVLPRRTVRHLDGRLRTYGISAVLALATVGGAAPQCKPATPPPPVVQVTDVQDSVVSSVNHQRGLVGYGALNVDARLTAAAQSHSDDMAQRATMTHTGTGGTSGGQRITNAGYRWSTWGENVAAGQSTPADVMAAWLASAGHRANILHGAMSHIGVAATTGPDGVRYWTMVVAAGG